MRVTESIDFIEKIFLTLLNWRCSFLPVLRCSLEVVGNTVIIGPLFQRDGGAGDGGGRRGPVCTSADENCRQKNRRAHLAMATLGPGR
jgi:hypothetical protein